MVTKIEAEKRLEAAVQRDYQIRLLEDRKRALLNQDAKRVKMIKLGVQSRRYKLEIAGAKLEDARRTERIAYNKRLKALRDVRRHEKHLRIYERQLLQKPGLLTQVNAQIRSRKEKLAKKAAGSALKAFVNEQARDLYEAVKDTPHRKTQKETNGNDQETKTDTKPVRHLFGRRMDGARAPASEHPHEGQRGSQASRQTGEVGATDNHRAGGTLEPNGCESDLERPQCQAGGSVHRVGVVDEVGGSIDPNGHNGQGYGAAMVEGSMA